MVLLLHNFSKFIESVDAHCVAHLGEAVRATLLDGSDITFSAIFDETYLDVDAGTGASFKATQPNLVFKDVHLSKDQRREAKYHVRGKVYKFDSVEPQGEGLVQLFLVSL